MKMTSRWRMGPAMLTALLVCLPAQALYKVVGPDGKVTYTDTPPPSTGGSKVTKLGASNNVVPEVAMPLDLRQALQRYPVTLYTMKVCDPCDSARQALKQRGIPFTEKQVLSNDDGDALVRLSGGRDAPTLTIGSQVLRGYASETWSSYLDAAGYPRESRLPANYQYAAPTPVVEVAPVARQQPAPAAPAALPAPAAPQADPSGIKF